MGFVINFESIKLAKSLGEPNRTNTNEIIPVSSRGAKKIPSLCSEQAVRFRLYGMRLPRCARNGGLPRPFRARDGHINHKMLVVQFATTRYFTR